MISGRLLVNVLNNLTFIFVLLWFLKRVLLSSLDQRRIHCLLASFLRVGIIVVLRHISLHTLNSKLRSAVLWFSAIQEEAWLSGFAPAPWFKWQVAFWMTEGHLRSAIIISLVPYYSFHPANKETGSGTVASLVTLLSPGPIRGFNLCNFEFHVPMAQRKRNL